MSNTVLAAQMHTLREFTRTAADIAATLKKVKALGYDAIQVSGFGPIERGALKAIIDGEGLTICSMHTGFDRLRGETRTVIDEYHVWDCRYVAVGTIPQAYREAGGEGYKKFAEEASEVARELAADGLIFSYHNHSFEFERFDGRTGLDILFEESDPDVFQFEIDTYWVQHGGADPAAWIRKAKGRADLIHVKDMAMRDREQLFAEVGEGNLNWPAILDACREAGARWYLVEQDRCERDPFESLGISLKNLKAMGLT